MPKAAAAYRFRDGKIFVGDGAEWPECSDVVLKTSRSCEADATHGHIEDGEIFFSCAHHKRLSAHEHRDNWPLAPESEMERVY